MAHAEEAVRLLQEAVKIFEEIERFEGSSNDGFPRRELYEKAIQKYFQDAYREIELVMSFCLELFGESVPRGERWHHLLIEMATLNGAERPPLAPGLRREFDELRRFRHVTTHGCGNFEMRRASPAVAAARIVAAEFIPALNVFLRQAFDREGEVPTPTP